MDAICALLEDRRYLGGEHDYNGIIRIALRDPPHWQESMLKIIPRMQSLPQPRILDIQSLADFPNIGLEKGIYTRIKRRVEQVSTMLRRHGYEI